MTRVREQSVDSPAHSEPVDVDLPTAAAAGVTSVGGQTESSVPRPELDPDRSRLARLISRTSAVVAVAIGLLVLAGWAFDVRTLRSLSSGMVSTKPDAALAIAFLGGSLLLLSRDRGARRARTVVALVLAAVAGAIALLTLAEYAFGVDLGIDQLLFHEAAGAVGTASPGRMAVMTAVSILLTAGALAALARGRVATEQIMASVVLAFAFSAVLSFLYGAEMAQPPGTTRVSAMSVVGVALLGVSMLLAAPESGPVGTLLGHEPGGLTARWLLAGLAVMLPVLGGLRLAGQDLGLYSASSGVGIMVIASLAVMIGVVSLTASRLNALGRQRTSALVRLRRSEQWLRRTLDHLVHAQENERRALAMDLHDDALPALAAVNLQLELASERCEDPAVRARLERAEAELRATTSRLRHLTFDLLPAALAREGLGAALRHRLERMHELTGVDYELRDRVGKTASPEAAAILYRATLEALRNVSRHADASTIRVAVVERDGRLIVTVADDGVGIGSAPSEQGHMGLSMMRDRAELAGGGLEISSEPGCGTTLTVWVPAGLSHGLEAPSERLFE